MGEFGSSDADPDVEAADVPDRVCSFTLPKARRSPHHRMLSGSVTPGVDCNKAGPPIKECRAYVDAAVGGSAQRPVMLPARVKVGLVFESVCWG